MFKLMYTMFTESLVKGLNSSDQDVLQKSMQQADQLIASHQAGAGDGGSTDADDEDDIHTKTGQSTLFITSSIGLFQFRKTE